MLKTTLRGSAKIVKPQEILLLYYINVLLAYQGKRIKLFTF